MEYRDYVQAHHEPVGERCPATTVLEVSDDAHLRVVCHLTSGHLGKHRADIVPLGKDGMTPFGFVTEFEWMS